MWAGQAYRHAKPACLAHIHKPMAPPHAPHAHRASSPTLWGLPAARHALEDHINPEGGPPRVSYVSQASLALNLDPPLPPLATLAPRGRTRPARAYTTPRIAACVRQATSRRAWVCRMPTSVRSVQLARYRLLIEPIALHADMVHSAHQARTRQSCAETKCWRATEPACWPDQDISLFSKDDALGLSPAPKEPDAALTRLTTA